MPLTLTYPGVYIEELPSAVHTIIGVATSTTAFVGYTKRGPVSEPAEVFNFGDFERSFGSLDPDCPLTYAVQRPYGVVPQPDDELVRADVRRRHDQQ